MSRITTLAVAVLLAVGVAHAQTSAGAQAGAGASAQSQAGANTQRGSGSGAQASGSGSAATSANASAQAGESSVALSDGTTMNAALAGSLDAGKSRPGDRVEARTTQDVKQAGKVVVPKGTHLIGHVTQAQARTREQTQSSVGVVFDQAIMRDGRQVPMNLAIQALAASQAEFQGGQDSFSGNGSPALSSVATSGSAGGVAGGGLVGGTLGATGSTVGSVGSVAGGAGQTVGAGVGSSINTATHSAGSVGGLNAAGTLTSNSQGVFGLQGLSMDGAATSATQGSMIVSSTRNVHLDSGTQILLRVAGQAH